MAGRINYYGNSQATGRPSVVAAIIGKSTVIRAGDVLVRTTSSSYTSTVGVPVVRPLNSGDTITTSAPPFAIASMDITTDASGNVIAQTSPVTRDQQKMVIWPFPSMASAGVRDPDTGYMIFEAWSLGGGNLFSGQTASNDVADWYQLNRLLGIVASAATPPINYTLDDDAAAANAPFRVTNVDTVDSQFNSANGGGTVIGAFLDTFNGAITGNTFSN